MSGKRTWSEYWSRSWNAIGGSYTDEGYPNTRRAGTSRTPDNLATLITALSDNPLRRVYASRRAQGYKAIDAIRVARSRARMDQYAWEFVWMGDYNYTRDGDCLDNASVLNRCEFEHDGRHIERGSRSKCRCTCDCKSTVCGNYQAGHRHGTLYSDCCYAPTIEVAACALVEQCERHEGREDYDPFTCNDCEVLEALHGIEESLNNRERKEYRASVEDDLLSEALHNADKEENERTRAARMDVATIEG